MTNEDNPLPANMIAMLRKMIPDQVAESIVQATEIERKMFPDAPSLIEAYKNLWDSSCSEDWLIENGYEPVSGHNLMWVKK